MPPGEYEYRKKGEGIGWNLVRDPDNYCDYMRNYTTTYDLMHNLEVRRAGCKPKPWRKWRLIQDALWYPQPDNAVSFVSLIFNIEFKF